MIKIKHYREQRGLTQEELAEILGTKQQIISRWENGTRVPTIANVIKLSEALKVSIEELIKHDYKANEEV